MNKNLTLLAFTVPLVIGVVLIVGGCAGNGTKTVENTEVVTETQIIESLAPQESFTLMQNNQNNPDFAIIDFRTFSQTTIGETKIQVRSRSETFGDELDHLDRDILYLIFSKTGERSGLALVVMEELNFREVYNISGGIDAWQEEKLPVFVGDCCEE